MIKQVEFQLPALQRGCHLITSQILEHLPDLPEQGLLNIFVKHTSCALTINENADPDVRSDLDNLLNHIAPEREPYYQHMMEGDDDMPAHAKSTILGVSVTIPITNKSLNLGIWQGIYLCEFRDYAGKRSIVLTLYA